MSLGGRRADAPCGESIAGPTWFAFCFLADWRDWWDTAVSIRRDIIALVLGNEGTPAMRDWLRAWVDADASAVASGLAVSVADTQADARWPSDPGAVWSRGRLQDLIAYANTGAVLLREHGGRDLFRDESTVEGQRQLKTLAVGLGLGLAALVALVAVLR